VRPAAALDAALYAVRLAPEAAAAHGVSAVALSMAELAGLLPSQPALSRVDVDAAWSAGAAGLLAPAQRPALQAVFAHGTYDGARATPAGILLGAADGAAAPLYAEDFAADLDGAPADFVLLGVCSAARGTLQRGDEAARHLGGALLQAGARVVALADFDLEVSGLILLTRSLLAALARGEAPDLALRTARRAMHDAGRSSPVEWAQLRLEGLATEAVPVATTRPSSSGWWWGGGLLLVCALVWRWSRRR